METEREREETKYQNFFIHLFLCPSLQYQLVCLRVLYSNACVAPFKCFLFHAKNNKNFSFTYFLHELFVFCTPELTIFFRINYNG